MTITVKVHRWNGDGAISSIDIKITEDSLEQFQQLIHRGLNCWEDAPADLKEFGDMLTHGRITQNHVKQRINSGDEVNPELMNFIERGRIKAYIEDNGQEAWLERIREGSALQVAAGTYRPKERVATLTESQNNPNA